MKRDPYRPEAPTLRWLWVITLTGFLIAAVWGWQLLAASPAGATSGPNPNDPATYETDTSICYKADSTTAHGTVQGGTVTLNPHQSGWYGNGWVLLVVKGGDGRNIYPNPTAGVPYSTPLNGGGQVPDVSHWIVCKGTVPETTTTTTPPPTVPPTTVPETTTTTVVTPPTTVPETTTTTAPDPCELSTVDPECGEQPEQTPPWQPPTLPADPCSVWPETCIPAEITPEPLVIEPVVEGVVLERTLPNTGVESWHLAVVGVVLAWLGGSLLWLERYDRKRRTS